MDALQLRARRRPHRRGSPPDTRLLMSSSPFSGFWLAPLETVSNVLHARAGACPAALGCPGASRGAPVRCDQCTAVLGSVAAPGCAAISLRAWDALPEADAASAASTPAAR